jgi:transcriptional regulator with XRE-family HTH domain
LFTKSFKRARRPPVNVASAIRQRLEELGLEQKELARAARVTESYVSQLLRRKKLPPDPRRTDIYEKMDKFLKLPPGELARLVTIERTTQLKRSLEDGLPPLFAEVRALLLRKCSPDKASEIRAIFDSQPFGELERLVTQKLLDVVKDVARKELEDPAWIRQVAKLGRRSYEETRVSALEFLDADVFDLSSDNCVSFLEPLVASWDVDLATFGLQVVLDHRAVADPVRRFEMVERDPESVDEQPGFREFLANPALSSTATAEELAFLKKLPFRRKQPTALYYYRELQSLRDPVHFRAG